MHLLFVEFNKGVVLHRMNFRTRGNWVCFLSLLIILDLKWDLFGSAAPSTSRVPC